MSEDELNVSEALPNLVPDFGHFHDIVQSISTMGYVLALNVRNTTPQMTYVTYPSAWWDEYTSNRYLLFDPVVYWGVINTGHIRWSEVASSTPVRIIPGARHVMARAAEHGLNYGVSFSRKSSAGKKLKSFFTLARSDREITDEEITILSDIFEHISAIVENTGLLTKHEIEVLTLASQGLSYQCTSERIGVSASTVKTRLASARKSLGVETTIEAVLIAQTRGIVTSDIAKSSKW